MPTKTIVQAYVLGAISRAEVTWAQNGTVVLTVPEFPGTVACGATPPEALKDLYYRLEKWVLRSLSRGFRLPPMTTKDGIIDLNTEDGRALAAYHVESEGAEDAEESVYIGGPDELKAYLESLDRLDRVDYGSL